jgi:tRNA-splicing ligase RtcB
MSRKQALKHWRGRQVVDDLAEKGVLIRSPSQRGVAEEAPGAYKDVSVVVDAAHRAGLAARWRGWNLLFASRDERWN